MLQSILRASIQKVPAFNFDNFSVVCPEICVFEMDCIALNLYCKLYNM